ncbi:MAG TPA: Abi family protein [Prolixibacteraceae bacterium]|nr:Abi family protein [Prolixibacteraceae bacterium]
MTKSVYNKPPTTYEQQVEIVKQRGLFVPDEPRAFRYFQQIGYYRLSAFFLPFQLQKDKFNEGTEFDDIIDLYTFDRKLRLLVFDCIERIEVAIRTQLTYILAHNHNSSHWHDMKAIYKAPYTNQNGKTFDTYQDFQNIIQRSCTAKKPEVFIKHYLDTYHKPATPPSWMCTELLTIGELSRMYVGLKHNSDRKQIADYFGVHQTVFTSWLHTLTYVRNLCAHHSRLWNRDFAIKPEILLKPKHAWVDGSFNNNSRTFYFLCVLKYLLFEANPHNHLTYKIDELFDKFPNVPIQFLGIPSNAEGELLNWKQQALWK